MQCAVAQVLAGDALDADVHLVVNVRLEDTHRHAAQRLEQFQNEGPMVAE